MSIGCDIEDNSRFENKSDRFLNKIFSCNEISYCKAQKNPSSHFCARFCAKEAVIKAFSTIGIKLHSYSQIEVLKNKENIPYINVKKEGFEKYKILISISHEKEKSIAFAAISENF